MRIDTDLILSLLPWFILLGVCLALNIISLTLLVKGIKEKITAKMNVAYVPTMSEEQIKKILNGTINDIFIKRQTLVYDLNNVRFYELQDELKEICSEIDTVFSESFKKEFAFYFTNEYWYKYIVNLVELLLLDDLKQRRVRN